ncbi:MAG: hypothetical protein AB8B65_14430 [Kordia sp.]|uniref:hypothetical protein n=1 Tax=Kordia sp. TaxID=1965332 RepID=UPI00385AED9D
MRNQTKSLNKLLLSKVKIAKVSEQQMILGGHNRSKRGQSKTGNSTQNAVGQIQVVRQQDEIVFM